VDIRESKKLCHPLHKNGQTPDDVRRRSSSARYQQNLVFVVEATADEV